MSAGRGAGVPVAALVLALAVSLTTHRVAAQDCDPLILDAPPGVPAEHPAELVRRLEARIGVVGYRQVVDSLAVAYATFAPEEKVPPEIGDRFRVELARARAEFAAVYESEDPSELMRVSGGVNVGRFTPARRPMSTDYELFGADRTTAVSTAGLSEVARRALCFRAVTLHGVLNHYAQPGMELVAAELRAKVRRWRSYHRSAPTQYPWELALNGFAAQRAPLEPPRAQWIFLHPAVAGELSGRRFDTLFRNEVIAFEWLGYVWLNRAATRSRGVSLLSTFADDLPASAGVMGRYGRALAIGAVARRVDGEWHFGGTMSLDLYRMLAGNPEELKEALAVAERRAAAASEKARSGGGGESP